MKLITHNLLICNRKSCSNGMVKNFPLKLTVGEWKDYDEETAMQCTKTLMKRLCEKLEWTALVDTVKTVSLFPLIMACYSWIGVSPFPNK